jgi:hypothetical protein
MDELNWMIPACFLHTDYGTCHQMLPKKQSEIINKYNKTKNKKAYKNLSKNKGSKFQHIIL